MPESFEETDAWRTARNLSKEIYSLYRRGPLCKDFGLCDQLRRASISVMNNIAEGWETIHAAEKKQAYNYARRSCGEIRSMTYALLDNQFINELEQKSLVQLCIKAGQLVSGLIRSVDKR